MRANRYGRTYSIAGEWYTILRDCDAPNSARPVVARLRRAIGIVEQLGKPVSCDHSCDGRTCLFISNAEQPPCSAPAGLIMSVGYDRQGDVNDQACPKDRQAKDDPYIPSSTAISKTVRPSSFSGSSATSSSDISFHMILEAISDSKPLAPLGLASCS